ncbi:MAG: SLBB domain-containing protein [Acidobacteriota bacterium]
MTTKTPNNPDRSAPAPSDKIFALTGTGLRSLARFGFNFAVARLVGESLHASFVLAVAVEVTVLAIVQAWVVAPFLTLAPGRDADEKTALFRHSRQRLRRLSWLALLGLMACVPLASVDPARALFAGGVIASIVAAAWRALDRGREESAFRASRALALDVLALAVHVLVVVVAIVSDLPVLATCFWAAALGNALALIIARVIRGSLGATSLTPELNRRYDSLARPMTIGSMGNAVGSRLQPFVLAAAGGVSAVSSFGLAAGLVGPLRLVSMALSGVLRPRFARHVNAGEPEDLRHALKRALQLVGVLALLAAIALPLAGNVLVELLVGRAYELRGILLIASVFTGLEAIGAVLVVHSQCSDESGAARVTKWRLSLAFPSLALTWPAAELFGAAGAFGTMAVFEAIFVGALLSRVVFRRRDDESHSLARPVTTALVLVVLASQALPAEARRKSRSSGEDPAKKPTWIEHLDEKVEPVPVDEPDDLIRPAITTPFIPKGRPRDLTGRLAAPAKPKPPPPPKKETKDHGHGGCCGGGFWPPPDWLDREEKKEATPAPPKIRSLLEKLYYGRFERKPNRDLKQFGYDYFAGNGSMDELGPVPESYLIGAGDEIQITVWGSFEDRQVLTVERDGTVAIEGIGSVLVAGRRFGDLHDILRRAYNGTRRDYQLSVSMGQLRRVRVHVVGNVAKPGMTEVPARASVLTALVAAGGPTKSGTLRRVQLRRDGRVGFVDLYEFLLGGELPPGAWLQEGDVLHVGDIGPTIGVAGYVQRPGIYEWLNEPLLEDAIALAGGLTPFTFKPQVQVERTVSGRGRETLDVNLDDEGLGLSLGDGELVLIGAVDSERQPRVEIVGEVVRPGLFQHVPGLRVSDLVAKADGLTVDAFLPQAFLSRLVGEPGAVEIVPDRMQVGSRRRIIVVDLQAALAGVPEEDLELEPLDRLEIRSRSQSLVESEVKIFGAVQRPGTYRLTPEMRVSDLIALAGNVLPEVFHDEAELIRRVQHADGRRLDVRRYRFDLGLALTRSAEHDPVLRADDELVIRALRSEKVRVRIDGEVRFPGTYVFPAGARITDLLAAAGGVLGHADLRAAVFSREKVRRQQQKRFRHLAETTRRRYEAALERMTQTGHAREGLAAKLAVIQTQDLLSRMANQQVTGRVVIPFVRDDFPDSEFNLTLESGDALELPRQLETVSIKGHVFNPTTFVAERGMRVVDLLERAGGITEQADEERIYLIRADGNVEQLGKRGRKNLRRSELLAGDTVLVPRQALERTFAAKLADFLLMARHGVETGLLLSHYGDGTGELSVTDVLQPPDFPNVGNYDDTILKR